MKKIISVAMLLLMCVMPMAFARIAKLDDTTEGCIGTDCEVIGQLPHIK